MTKHAEFFAALAAPFKRGEVKTLKKGKTISYVTARTVMNRLDEVVGPENWWDDYIPGAESVICRLTLVLPDGKEVTKVDAGGYAGMSDQGDDDKSGFSDAFKRAAVKFGVSRYLYEDGVPNFAASNGATSEPRTPYHNGTRRPVEPSGPESSGRPSPSGNGSPPRTGKALFAWVKAKEQEHELSLLKYINAWAKLQDLPGRMVDWNDEQVGLAVIEANRKIEAATLGRPEPATQPAAPFATTKETQRFESQVNTYCQRMNMKWADRHTGPSGEIPSWVKDLISPFQIVNHMLKTAGLTLPEGGNFNERMRAATKLWLADEPAVTGEWNAYVAKLAAETKAKHAPVEPEDVSQEPALASTTAGREPGSDDDA